MGLAFERLGSGPPLVLLHGVGHRRQAWDAVLDRLAPHRDVIAALELTPTPLPSLDTLRIRERGERFRTTRPYFPG